MNEILIPPPERENSRRDSNGTDVDETQRCPECSGSVERREARGERLCAECGLVLEAEELDRGPEWRSFSDEETDRRSRVGAPYTERIHDRGLSTTISWQDRDAHGNRLSATKRAQLRRLRKWDERFRTRGPKERNLKQAFGELERMAAALGIPKPCRETAAAIYRRAVENDLLPGRSIEAMTTASLYAATRQHNTPRTLGAFESVSRVEKLPIQRAYRYLSGELGLAIPPQDPLEYLPQFASELEVGDDVEALAREILETSKRQGVHTGKKPAGITAAAIYAATRISNEHLTQPTVSERVDVSVITIRKRYQELLEAYETADG